MSCKECKDNKTCVDAFKEYSFMCGAYNDSDIVSSTSYKLGYTNGQAAAIRELREDIEKCYELLDRADCLISRRWILVKDKLPPDNEPVIFFTTSGERGLGIYNHNAGRWLSDLFYITRPVVAWMPLPEIPRSLRQTDCPWR